MHASKHGRPSHPHTQGKAERFHQTLKSYPAKQDPAQTNRQLQGQLDRFVTYYNTMRPHRAIARPTPVETFATRDKSHSLGPRIDSAGYRVRNDKVDRSGKVTLRYRGRLHHIGVRRSYAGWRVVLLVAGREVRILSADGHHCDNSSSTPTRTTNACPELVVDDVAQHRCLCRATSQESGRRERTRDPHLGKPTKPNDDEC